MNLFVLSGHGSESFSAFLNRMILSLHLRTRHRTSFCFVEISIFRLPDFTFLDVIVISEFGRSSGCLRGYTGGPREVHGRSTGGLELYQLSGIYNFREINHNLNPNPITLTLTLTLTLTFTRCISRIREMRIETKPCARAK